MNCCHMLYWGFFLVLKIALQILHWNWSYLCVHFLKSLFPFYLHLCVRSTNEDWKTYFLSNCEEPCLGPFQVHFFQFQGFDSSRDKLTQQHQIAILLIGLLTYQAQVVRWVWDKFKITFSGQSFQTWISQKVKIFLDLNRRKMFSLQTYITNKLKIKRN